MRRELLALLLIGCGATPPACPDGTRPDTARASAIEARLSTVSEGRALIESAHVSICFVTSGSSSVITTDRVVLLASELEEGEAAARLGHLLVHARDGLPIDLIQSGLDHDACEAAVDRALTLEARAYVTEIALQDALGAHPTTLAFAFAADVRAAPEPERESIAHAYLVAHPDGGPGLDGLAAAYRARCD